MGQREPSYVHEHDAGEFPAVDVKSRGYWTPFDRQTVVVVIGDCFIPKTGEPDGEGLVALEGFQRVATKMIEIAESDNPRLAETEIRKWERKAKAADDEDKKFNRNWEVRLNLNPILAAALERGVGAVCERASLTAFQTRAVELMLDGKSRTEVGVALGITRQSATERIEAALEKILSLDREDENAIPALSVMDYVEIPLSAAK